MATNLSNYGVLTGRLTQDPQIFNNSDGSKKVKMTIATQNNYKDANGERSSQFIPTEAFIPAGSAKEGIGPYALMHQGDKVTAMTTLKNNYTDKNAELAYGMTYN